eukprot:403368352
MNFSDHMFQVDYSLELGGWQKPKITPYAPFPVHTTASCLHYAINHFEGLSVYQNKESGVAQAFRVEDTLQSFYDSADYLDMPLFDKNELMKCLGELIKLEYKWFPQIDKIDFHQDRLGNKLKSLIGIDDESRLDRKKLKPQLYVRLVHISTYKVLGIKSSQETKLYAIVNPTIIDESDLKVKCSSNVVKSWPLGHGRLRLSGNLGSLLPTVQEAKEQGYDDILWMLDDYVKELTVQNVFIYWKSRYGQRELIIPQSNGCIFEGLIRKTVIDLKDEIEQDTGAKIVVRDVSIHELISAYREFRLIEMFSSSSSSKIQSISRLIYKDNLMELNPDQYLANFIRQKFDDITTTNIKPQFITQFTD